MIRTEHQGHFLTVWLEAPATRNALNDRMVQGLQDALVQAAALHQLRAVVLRGAGGTFCAGGDFSRFRNLMAEPVPDQGLDPIAGFNRAFGALLQTWRESPVLTIAAVEGAAFGGGCGLAAACDMVLATDSAQFAMPEVTLGLPPSQIAPFVAARLGERNALRLMASGQRVSGAEAMRLGLVDELVPSDGLDAALQRWADQLQRAEPQALRATRAILRSSARQSLDETLDFAAQCFADSLRSGTASEGMAAFAAKRRTAWTTQT